MTPWTASTTPRTPAHFGPRRRRRHCHPAARYYARRDERRLRQGEAVPLADTVSWLVRYQRPLVGRLRTRLAPHHRHLTAADLDHTAARITPSQARVARDTQIRATLALTPDPAASQETEHPCPPPKP